jgi:peptide/nickel transport system substrate-binding protein
MSSGDFYNDDDGLIRRAEDDALTLPVTMTRQCFVARAGALGIGAMSLSGLIASLTGEDANAAVRSALVDAAKGGTLVFAIDSTAGVADPAFYTSLGDWMVVDCVGRGLTVIDFTTTAPQPDLSTGWKVSADGLTYAFTIRKGVQFQDGSTLTARDVERSFNRQLLDGDPSIPKTVSGAPALRGATGRNITSVKATDDNTIVITLNKMDRTLPSRLSDVPARIISAKALDTYKDNISSNLVGAGPFKWVSGTAGQSITLAAFDNYYKGRPPIDRLVLQQTSDPSALVGALLTNQIQGTSFAPYSAAKQLRASSKVKVWDTPELVDHFLMMNVTKPALADLRVRQAINYAIDRQAIVKNALFGEGEVPVGYALSRSEVGHNPALAKYSTRDLARAKSLLPAEAKGRSVEIAAQNDGWHPAAAQIVANNLRELGLDPKVNLIPGATFTGVAFDITGHELLIWERNDYVPDPDNKIGNMFESTGTYSRFVTGQGTMGAGINGPIDAAIFKARNLAKGRERTKLYTAVQKLLCEQVMNCAMLAYARNLVVTSSTVSGINAAGLSTQRMLMDKASVK